MTRKGSATPTGIRYIGSPALPAARISGNETELFCIIGMPARHSLSPAMHNAAFNKLGMDAVFLAFDVPPKSLKATIDAMRGTGMKGMTLTSPHKLEVMKLIDRIDKKAAMIGAVNTVISENGRLVGYNTDAPGFMESIRKVANPNNKKFVVIGAGGAARAFVFEILTSAKGAEVTVLNRHLKRAADIRRDAKRHLGRDVTALALNDANLEKALRSADIVANATNITLENGSDTPVPRRLLRKRMVVFDANYVPLNNRLIRDAREAGCKVVTGKDLLLYQGVVAFRLFTGVNAPEGAMSRAIDSVLRKRRARD